MKWRGRRRSTNVVDQRGQSGRRSGGFGGSALGRGTRIPIPTGKGGKMSFGGIALMILVFAVLYFLNDEGGGPGGQFSENDRAAQAQMQEFAAVVLADTEDVWNPLLPSAYGRDYREPTLVLFSGGVESGCGFASSAVGPFYCPAGERIYLDLTFFDELTRRFGVEGDFAPAYVIAHEVGHHVQTVTGISAKVRAAQAELGEAGRNELSVRQELQADCLAGVWAKRADSMNQILEPGDITEAMNAASAIGDDTLQKQSQGYAVPDSFTHGTSAQRQRWFTNGYNSGDPAVCDTFAAAEL